MASREKSRDGRREYLLATLHNIGIELSTAEYKEAGHRHGMKGVFCKNLFLKDRKGVFYLVICEEDCQVDLKWLKHHLKAARNFSFARGDELISKLDVDPGCVSPFALINDAECTIKVIIDINLQLCNDLLNFHPLNPKETSLISFDNLMKFLLYCGYQPVVTSMYCSGL